MGGANPVERIRGRPEKHRQILDAAAAAFLEAGYGACSMDQIAQSAGVSKQTIYHHFGSKDALFQAILQRITDDILAPLQTMPDQVPAREALTALAEDLISVALEPSSLGLYRLLIAEGPRQAGLGESAYESGAGPAIEALAGYLEERARLGEIAPGDAHVAAAHFYGMVVWHLQLRALLGVDTAPSPREVRGTVEATVGAFLRAYAPDGTTPG